MQLGKIGIWSHELHSADSAELADNAPELEELGYGTLWFPAGDDGFAVARRLLTSTSTATVATGILSIWVQPAEQTGSDFLALQEAHPDRFLLGLGVSHAKLVDKAEAGRYQRPIAKLGAYLDALDATVPLDRRVLAALGPRALELARDRALGTHPYLVNPDHLARIREQLGPEPLIAAEQAVVFETDASTARAIARKHLALYLTLPNYTNNWLRIGFTTDDLRDGGSDRLVDSLVAWGDADSIVTRVTEMQEAGADHVCLQVLTGAESAALPMREWRLAAEALLPR